MAKKPCVKMYLVKGNWIEAHPELHTEEQEFDYGIAMNRLPVVKYSGAKKCNLISLYYYTKAVRVLEKAGFVVYVEERIAKYHKRLRSRLNKRTVDLPSKRPTTWVKDKDKVVLGYQLEAVRCGLRRNKFIYAEQMGLGKTIEALCTMCYAFDMGYKRALIIVMASLKEQWKSEILKFTTFTEDDIIILGDAKKVKCRTGQVEKYHGGKKVCKECQHVSQCSYVKSSVDKIRRDQLLRQKETKIVITNYAVLNKYAEQIKKGDFDIYIVDEASKLKNYGSGQTKGMMKIARNFKFDDIFLPMSGTLIENRIQEFYPVFSMIDDAIFGTWTNFKNRYLVTDFFGKPVDVKNTDELKKIVSKFIIRRTTDEVWKDRPPLYEMYRYCEMSKIHAQTYNEILEGEVEDLRDNLDSKINRMQVATLLVYLIMVADSLEVVKKLGKHTPDEYSCKLAMLKDIMTEEIDGKVVLFSKYAKKVIPIIEREMKKIGVKCILITGATKTKDRYGLVQKFKKSKKIRMLICSDAMGYGANLQFVQYVINFDLPWNPAKLDQRIARVYRKGQKRPVTVINLVTKNSAEDLVLDKIYSKREMISRFIKEGIKPTEALKGISVNDILKAVVNV